MLRPRSVGGMWCRLSVAFLGEGSRLPSRGGLLWSLVRSAQQRGFEMVAMTGILKPAFTKYLRLGRLTRSMALVVLVVLAPLASASAADCPVPAAETLTERFESFFGASSRELVVSVTTAYGRFVAHTRFSLWMRGSDRALLRIEGPQRAARRTLLRKGGRAFVFEPERALVRSCGKCGARGGFARPYLEFIDALLETDLDKLVVDGEVAGVNGPAGRLFKLTLSPKTALADRCRRIEVDFLAESHDPLEVRCITPRNDEVRLRLRRLRDIGGRQLPTEIEIQSEHNPEASMTVRLLRVGLDSPIGRERFTLSALRAME